MYKKQSYSISCGGILLPDNYGKLTSQILFDQSAINLWNGVGEILSKPAVTVSLSES